jgi:hypothetical protein
MLDPWIIEEIRRREEERRNERQPARIEMPIHNPADKTDRVKPPEDETPRGVVVIDFSVG